MNEATNNSSSSGFEVSQLIQYEAKRKNVSRLLTTLLTPTATSPANATNNTLRTTTSNRSYVPSAPEKRPTSTTVAFPTGKWSKSNECCG